MAGLYPSILGVVLTALSHPSPDIAEVARQTSEVLLAYTPEVPELQAEGEMRRVSDAFNTNNALHCIACAPTPCNKA